MSGWTFRLKTAPALRVDLRGVTPSALSALAAAEIERLPVVHGNAFVPLAEFFHLEPRADDSLVFAADLSRFDHVGWQMEGGTLVVEGGAGHGVGAAMRGGELRVHGNAGAQVACEMSGGTLVVDGNVGDFAASTLPGSMDGMRGGTLVVKGDAGARLGDRMRRGTVVVFGRTGDFTASRMVAGTIALGGAVGAHCGHGMRRGSVIFAGEAPPPAPTFVPTLADVPVIWQLLSRNLARHGGVFAGLPSCRIERRLGDLAAQGKGELIVAL